QPGATSLKITCGPSRNDWRGSTRRSPMSQPRSRGWCRKPAAWAILQCWLLPPRPRSKCWRSLKPRHRLAKPPTSPRGRSWRPRAPVSAPAELARRLAQIGVVARERGAELVSQLKTGQRLVSLEGDVWRWDGFVAAAHAPTGAARRLAERARLVDIENELERA